MEEGKTFEGPSLLERVNLLEANLEALTVKFHKLVAANCLLTHSERTEEKAEVSNA